MRTILFSGVGSGSSSSSSSSSSTTITTAATTDTVLTNLALNTGETVLEYGRFEFDNDQTGNKTNGVVHFPAGTYDSRFPLKNLYDGGDIANTASQSNAALSIEFDEAVNLHEISYNPYRPTYTSERANNLLWVFYNASGTELGRITLTSSTSRQVNVLDYEGVTKIDLTFTDTGNGFISEFDFKQFKKETVGVPELLTRIEDLETRVATLEATP